MYKLKNKITGAIVFGLKFYNESVHRQSLPENASTLDVWSSIREPKVLVPIWRDFLSNVPHELEDRNWQCIIKLYEAIVVKEGNWVLSNQEGFYFPITEELLKARYDFIEPEKL